MEEVHVDSTHKKACREGRVVVFIDESGLSEQPTRLHTWAPRGQTPAIQFHFNWKHLSMIADVRFTSTYFRLHPGTIKSPQIAAFLRALVSQIKQPLLIIWDELLAHRSWMVREYLDTLDGPHRNGLPAALGAGAESGRIPVGLAQASRAGEFLYQFLCTTGPHNTRQARVSAATHHLGRSVLEAGGTFLMSRRNVTHNNHVHH